MQFRRVNPPLGCHLSLVKIKFCFKKKYWSTFHLRKHTKWVNPSLNSDDALSRLTCDLWNIHMYCIYFIGVKCVQVMNVEWLNECCGTQLNIFFF